MHQGITLKFDSPTYYYVLITSTKFCFDSQTRSKVIVPTDRRTDRRKCLKCTRAPKGCIFDRSSCTFVSPQWYFTATRFFPFSFSNYLSNEMHHDITLIFNTTTEFNAPKTLIIFDFDAQTHSKVDAPTDRQTDVRECQNPFSSVLEHSKRVNLSKIIAHRHLCALKNLKKNGRCIFFV